jgi:hypothetical protein
MRGIELECKSMEVAVFRNLHDADQDGLQAPILGRTQPVEPIHEEVGIALANHDHPRQCVDYLFQSLNVVGVHTVHPGLQARVND